MKINKFLQLGFLFIAITAVIVDLVPRFSKMLNSKNSLTWEKSKITRVCRKDEQHLCGNLTDMMQIQWDEGHTELYVKNKAGVYEAQLLFQPVKFISYPDSGGFLYMKSHNKVFFKEQNKEGFLVLNDEDKIIILWDEGFEQFKKSKQGFYVFDNEPLEIIKIIHPDWIDKIVLLADNRFIRSNRDAGNIFKISDEMIILKWDDWPAEIFVKNKDGAWQWGDLAEKKQYVYGSDGETLELILVEHPEWFAQITLLANNRFMRDNGEGGSVLKKTDKKIILKWDDWGIETFVKNEKGIYQYKEEH